MAPSVCHCDPLIPASACLHPSTGTAHHTCSLACHISHSHTRRTFTTGYRGSGAGPAGPQSAHGSSGELAWEATDAQMDRGMLTARDPILMYADIPLFESELEDNGVASLSVKVTSERGLAVRPPLRVILPSVAREGGGRRVLHRHPMLPVHRADAPFPMVSPPPQVRVMPRCWYALLRFWLRVDGVLVRLRTTRVFCAFKDAPDVVLREVRWTGSTLAWAGCTALA